MSETAGRHFLQIPGPSNVPDRVLRAMDMPTMDHRGPEFVHLTHAVVDGMKKVFKTEADVVIFPASGTGAWEAALVNTLSSGDKVLFVETGQFATLWQKMAKEGGRMPEFLSTHPAPENRAEQLAKLVTRVEPLYLAAKAREGKPVRDEERERLLLDARAGWAGELGLDADAVRRWVVGRDLLPEAEFDRWWSAARRELRDNHGFAWVGGRLALLRAANVSTGALPEAFLGALGTALTAAPAAEPAVTPAAAAAHCTSRSPNSAPRQRLRWWEAICRWPTAPR